jgi:hypothetical protein
MTDGGEPSAGATDPPIGADGAAQRGRRALNPLSVAGNLEYDRVLFFSDAVFAIAITLLVVDLRVPDVVANAAEEIANSKDKILSFTISFLVIGLFWMGHHRLFRYITALDRRVIFLNLLFLGTIAFLPYPTALLFAGNTHEPAAPVFYASCVAGAGLLELAIWLYASRSKGLVPASVPPRSGAMSWPSCCRPRWCSCCRSRWRSSPRAWRRSRGYCSCPSAGYCPASCGRRRRARPGADGAAIGGRRQQCRNARLQ